MQYFLLPLIFCLHFNSIVDIQRPLPSTTASNEKTIFYELGETVISIHTKQYGSRNDITCINLHANEYTSVSAAMQILDKEGGFLIRIGNGDERKIRFKFREKFYSFDPNRMFSRIGIAESLKESTPGNAQVVSLIEEFAKRLLKLIPEETKCVIALHNNNEHGFSARSYLPGGDDQVDAKEIKINPEKDPDNFFFTTDNHIHSAMSSKGYNSVWQHNKKARKDGSLSVYYGERKKRYVNIETQHGQIGEYVDMLNTLIEFLRKEE